MHHEQTVWSLRVRPWGWQAEIAERDADFFGAAGSKGVPAPQLKDRKRNKNKQ
jgi:hypothetical protein